MTITIVTLKGEFFDSFVDLPESEEQYIQRMIAAKPDADDWRIDSYSIGSLTNFMMNVQRGQVVED